MQKIFSKSLIVKYQIKTKLLLILVMILAFVNSQALADIHYDVIDLDALNGDYSYAYSINNNGQVVGHSGYYLVWHPSPDYTAMLFNPTGDGNNIDLGGLPGCLNSSALAINDNGQIVGVSHFILHFDSYAVARNIATLFDTSGDGNNISLSSNSSSSFASSINNSGQIVGREKGRAAILDSSGAGINIDLGTLGGNYSFAKSINDNGDIVGLAKNSSGFDHATLFDPTGNGDNIDLGTLGGFESSAYSINNNRQIVGRSNYRATLFDASGDGNNVNLGTIENGGSSCAWSINNLGEIVGVASDSNDDWKAVLFDPSGDGNNIDLNTLIDPSSGWILKEARSVNDDGWIIGYGRNPEGKSSAFLLIPMTPHRMAVVSVEDAITRKHEALAKIDAALEKEWVAVDTLSEMVANSDFGDLSRRDIFKAKLRIFFSIMREIRGKAELQQSIRQLEMSLESLEVD